MCWGGLRGKEKPTKTGDCISWGPARETGTTWDVLQNGDLMQGICYKNAGRKEERSKRKKVGGCEGAGMSFAAFRSTGRWPDSCWNNF